MPACVPRRIHGDLRLHGVAVSARHLWLPDSPPVPPVQLHVRMLLERGAHEVERVLAEAQDLVVAGPRLSGREQRLELQRTDAAGGHQRRRPSLEHRVCPPSDRHSSTELYAALNGRLLSEMGKAFVDRWPYLSMSTKPASEPSVSMTAVLVPVVESGAVHDVGVDLVAQIDVGEGEPAPDRVDRIHALVALEPAQGRVALVDEVVVKGGAPACCTRP